MLSFSMTNEKFEIQTKQLQQMTISPVKGTLKVHAVSLDDKGILVLRDTSCYCDSCLKGTKCESWRKAPNFRKKTLEKENNTGGPNATYDGPEPFINATSGSDNDVVEYVVGDYVAAIYDNRWYVGQVSQEADDEDDIEILFMQQKGDLWQWPSQEDKIWCILSEILFKITELIPNGKSKRMFKLNAEDLTKVEAKFSAH